MVNGTWKMLNSNTVKDMITAKRICIFFLLLLSEFPRVLLLFVEPPLSTAAIELWGFANAIRQIGLKWKWLTQKKRYAEWIFLQVIVDYNGSRYN